MTEALERNLRLIPWHQVLISSSPWIAVFVLFTRARFDLDGAIQLAGIYYLSVVVFEVPSGWMSDRLGRVITLRIASLAWIVCFTVFLIGDDRFWMIAAGQALLALGYASVSGTDVSFHYETLEALGRAGDYADRQSWVASRGLIAAAVSALTGGLLGLIDLRLAFAAALVLAVVQFGLTLGFAEPAHADRSNEGFATQITTCLRYLRNIPLGWVFGYGVAMVVLEHVAFTLLQPWLTEMLGRPPEELGATPVIAGLTVGTTYLVGSFFARSAARLQRRFGLYRTLIGLGVLSAIIVSVMAASTHWIVLALIAFRGAQGSAAPILISAAIAPEVEPAHRATILSLDSLAGRLSYGGLLLLVSTDAEDDVAGVLWTFSAISWGLVALTVVTAYAVWRRFGAPATDYGGRPPWSS